MSREKRQRVLRVRRGAGDLDAAGGVEQPNEPLHREPFIVQRYLKDVRKGDKRIILIEGEPVGAINRVPAEFESRSNMHVGGRAEKTDLTARELEICARIGPSLRERGFILVGIDVKPGARLESQSGLQMLRPRIWGALQEPAGRRRVAAIVMHPASNFMGHYLIGPLAQRGVACMGLNSRYAGNDTLLLMERVLQDLGAGSGFGYTIASGFLALSQNQSWGARVPEREALLRLDQPIGHDYWAVGFGLAVMALILLTPESPEHAEPWRPHALRVVSACFVVVTVASMWTTLTMH